ncbi:MAG: aspartyl-phosphate phosphatase Spo0E family protein, partial [Desulfitobacterium hafniense]|nr:aspartyl-phosphate phosphatase Spo0E family protein [Desulfitobacterium hafniense]
NLREQLNTLALNRHLADTEVVRLSQMLDSFLNLYHKLYPGYSETGIIYFC